MDPWAARIPFLNVSVQFSSVQSLSRVQLFVTPWIARPPCPSPTEFTQTHVHQVGDAIQASHPLSSPPPPSPNPSQHQGLFQWVNSSHELAKVLEFSFSIRPSSEHPGVISFRMDWLDLLAVQGTLKCLVFFKKKLYWSIIDLQCCVNFTCTAKWFRYTYTHMHTCVLFRFFLI